jgi:hypothetical protein
MSAKKHSFERRTDKLRASCDACYLAKVKCSKSRPLCQRCLVSGTNCAYSPSARFKRGPKANGTDRGNEDVVTFRSQLRNETEIEYNPSIARSGPPSYASHNYFNQEEQYQTPTSTPCPGIWTQDLLVCADSLALFDGTATSELFTDDSGFGLSSPRSWWNGTSPSASSIAESGLNDNYTPLESSNIPVLLGYSTCFQNPTIGPSHLTSNNLNMSFTPSSVAGIFDDLDYGSSSTTGEIPDVELSKLNDAIAALQYDSREQ